MNNAAFMWKCDAHNLVLPVRISCPECTKLQRSRIHATGVCLVEEFDYKEQLKKGLRQQAKSPNFSYQEYAPRAPTYKPLTVTGTDAEPKRPEYDWPELKSKGIVEAFHFLRFTHEFRVDRQRSAEVLLNFIEHSCAAVTEQRAQVEATLDRLSEKARPDFDEAIALFGNVVAKAVRLYHLDSDFEHHRFMPSVRFSCAIQLLKNYIEGYRVGY